MMGELMKKLALAFILAACGGKSAPEATTRTSDSHTHHDHAAEEPAGTGEASPTPAETSGETPAPDPAQVKADLLAAEQAAYEKAKPVFDTYCAKCHSKESKKASAKALEHFDMTT